MFGSVDPPVVQAMAPAPFMECRLAVRGTLLPPWPGHALGRWAVGPVEHGAVVAAAADWALGLPGGIERCYLGYVSFVDGAMRRADFDWAGSLAAVTSVLARAGGWAVRGFVKRGSDWFRSGARALEGGWLSASQQRAEEEQYLLDAFGVVVLPGAGPPR